MRMLLDRFPRCGQPHPGGAVLVKEFAEDYCQALLHSFQQAVDERGLIADRHYNLAGHRLQVRISGDDRLLGLTPALDHRRVAARPNPELTIHVWNSDSIGTRLPLPPLPSGKGEHKAGQPDGLWLLDERRRQAFLWIRDVSLLPPWEYGAPLRHLLHWWLAGLDVQLIHAAAVGVSHGGVLLVGKGGSGKSTCALACLDHGMLYAGDDYVLTQATVVPSADSLYNSAKLELGHSLRFPELAERFQQASTTGGDKALIFIQNSDAGRLCSGFPIRAIFAPRVSGQRDTSLEPISAATVLRSLAPSTLLQLPGAGPRALRTMTELVARLPCYQLHVGTELAQIPRVVTQLLDAA